MLTLDEAPVIGKLGPLADGLDSPYWEGLHAGELRIQRCSRCQTWLWAPAWRCKSCGSFDHHWEAVEPKGVVYSWVRTWQSFAPETAAAVPFVTLLVELPQAGKRRVFGILVGPEEGLAIGESVAGVFQKPSERTSGYPILRWRLDR